ERKDVDLQIGRRNADCGTPVGNRAKDQILSLCAAPPGKREIRFGRTRADQNGSRRKAQSSLGLVAKRRSVAYEQIRRVSRFHKALRSWPWLAAISSGLLCTACFPPFNQSWLCWIALTPLIAAVWFYGRNSRRRWLRNLLLGYVAGVVFFTDPKS